MNKTLWQYYCDKAAEITDKALEDITSLEQWKKEREKRKKEFFISMGIYPLLDQSNLTMKIIGEFKGKGFKAKKIIYEILPDCWSSAHFYLPETLLEKKLPAVIVCCGHAESGIFSYQRVGIMWAKRGYACFVFDTIKQSENTGFHHGLFSGKRLDWISRGYSAAGGELLNSMRALDILCQMEEVDTNRIGATGHSGGGALCHFLGIADEKIKAVGTSCGVSTLKAAIKNRTMFYHCDCMYAYGNFQKDICNFSALIAPRALLYCYGKEDILYTKEEYLTLYQKTKKIYQLYGYPEKCELFEYQGSHSLSDETVKKINEWFDKYVAGEKHPYGKRIKKRLPDSVVSVFNGKSPQTDKLFILPEILTNKTKNNLPKNNKEWKTIRIEIVNRLRKNIFHWLDENDEKVKIEEIGVWKNEPDRKWSRYFGEVAGMQIYIEAIFPKNPAKNTLLVLGSYDDDIWNLYPTINEAGENCNIIFIEQRATGKNATNISHGNYCILRAAALTGITPVLMWINDLKYIIKFFQQKDECRKTKFILYGKQEAAGACLYYGIFDENIAGVILDNVIDTHEKGCYIVGIMKEIDITDASGLIAPRPIAISINEKVFLWSPKTHLHWGFRVYDRLGIKEKFIITNTTHTAISKLLSFVE